MSMKTARDIAALLVARDEIVDLLGTPTDRAELEQPDHQLVVIRQLAFCGSDGETGNSYGDDCSGKPIPADIWFHGLRAMLADIDSRLRLTGVDPTTEESDA